MVVTVRWFLCARAAWQVQLRQHEAMARCKSCVRTKTRRQRHEQKLHKTNICTKKYTKKQPSSATSESKMLVSKNCQGVAALLQILPRKLNVFAFVHAQKKSALSRAFAKCRAYCLPKHNSCNRSFLRPVKGNHNNQPIKAASWVLQAPVPPRVWNSCRLIWQMPNAAENLLW